MGAACDLLTKRQAICARQRATGSSCLMPWVTVIFWLQEITFFSALLEAEKTQLVICYLQKLLEVEN